MPDIQFFMHGPEQVPEYLEMKAVRRTLDVGMQDSSGMLYLSQNSENFCMLALYELWVLGARALYMMDCKVLTRSSGRDSSSSSLNLMENGVSQERIWSAAGNLGLSMEGSVLTSLGSILGFWRIGLMAGEVQEEDGAQEG